LLLVEFGLFLLIFSAISINEFNNFGFLDPPKTQSQSFSSREKPFFFKWGVETISTPFFMGDLFS